MKRCSKCKQEKPIPDFSVDRANKDGLRSQCKNCTKAYQQSDAFKQVKKQHRQSQKGRETYEKWKQGSGREVRNRASRNFKKRNINFFEASKAITTAISLGHLCRAANFNCLKCHQPADHWHHIAGYEPENQYCVIPVCINCHIKYHKNEA